MLIYWPIIYMEGDFVTEQEMTARLRAMLHPDRFCHTLGVAETARALAKIHGCDQQKAYVAGLLHDCAKNMGHAKLLAACGELGIVLDEVSAQELGLVHAYVGAHLAAREFGVDDTEIFDAIYYHTIGKPDMALLTKIIYLADSIEPNRRLGGELDAIRAVARTDLNQALMMCFDSSIKYVIRKGGLLHPNSILARNFLLAQMRKERKE